MVPPLRYVSPPVASTFPSGSIVRFRKLRGYAIDAVCFQTGDGCVMSRTNVVLEDGPVFWLSLALPAFTNLPGRYMVALPPSTILESTTDQLSVFRSRTSVSVAYSDPPM